MCSLVHQPRQLHHSHTVTIIASTHHPTKFPLTFSLTTHVVSPGTAFTVHNKLFQPGEFVAAFENNALNLNSTIKRRALIRLAAFSFVNSTICDTIVHTYRRRTKLSPAHTHTHTHTTRTLNSNTNCSSATMPLK
jgi:hypothetical protein